MQSQFTISDEPAKEYEYPKSPFATLQETVEATERLKRSVVPALWTGDRIIPCSYDASRETVSAEAICEYCYVLPEEWRIRGDAFILLDMTHADSDSALHAMHMYPYFDKTPIHKNVFRVVHNSTFPIPFLRKATAPKGHVFHRYRTVATPRTVLEGFLGEKYTDEHGFRLEIVDKKPDEKEEIVNDILVPEMTAEMDRETMLKILDDSRRN